MKAFFIEVAPHQSNLSLHNTNSCAVLWLGPLCLMWFKTDNLRQMLAKHPRFVYSRKAA